MSKVKAWAEQYNLQLKPITQAQKKYYAKQSAKYIFVHDKNGNATCSRCCKEINVGHTKHKTKLICPNCKTVLTVQHEWRMKKDLEIINWIVFPTVIDDYTVCLRYVLSYAKGNNPIEATERARLYVNENRMAPEFYCLSEKNEWIRGKGTYFRRPCMITPNRFWCGNAFEDFRNFHKELDKKKNQKE